MTHLQDTPAGQPLAARVLLFVWIYVLSGEIMQDFCHLLKENHNIDANFYLVGSGARNLITQNASQPIDLDYNL